LVAFANLLANDPISLVVARNVAEARGISADTPVRDRLRAMSGLRVGVAPGPPSRLRFLFESVGLDADRHLEIVIVPGPEQNEALQAGRVDALYSHTPYLERALVDQDAVMVVNQSAGEVVGLAGRQIHMLVTTRDYADGHRDVLVAMARAVHRAQGLIHSDREATIAAIRASGVAVRAPSALDVFVELYEPAVPSSPEVTVAGVLRELELFPDRRPLPDLSGIDMAAHVDNQFAREAVSDGR
jgi:NitT/TauT family transport system substrate-binding protein